MEESSTNLDRERGFRDELALLGSRIHARAVGNYSFDGAQAAARQLFGVATGKPDAVFVGSDQMALAVMDVLRSELGLRIPQDVSVVGFDDVPQAAWGAYQLTTIEQPIAQMVETTANLLQGLLHENAPPRTITVPCRLVVRQSSRASRSTDSFEAITP